MSTVKQNQLTAQRKAALKNAQTISEMYYEGVPIPAQFNSLTAFEYPVTPHDEAANIKAAYELARALSYSIGTNPPAPQQALVAALCSLLVDTFNLVNNRAKAKTAANEGKPYNPVYLRVLKHGAWPGQAPLTMKGVQHD